MVLAWHDISTPVTHDITDNVLDVQQLRDSRTGPVFLVDAAEQQEDSVAQQVLQWILLP